LAGCRTDTTMLNQIIELCTSSNGLFWLVLGSDLSIAVAYFAIPITMAIVLRDRKDDIPYPWLWTLFVTFIVACGLTHTAHVWSAATGFDYLEMHAAIGFFCAVASVGTAIAFAFILPQIKLLPSPRQQRAQLEKQVAHTSSSTVGRRRRYNLSLAPSRIDDNSTNIVRRGAMMKPLCIIAAAMALVVSSSTAMAEPKKRSVSDKSTHRMKSAPAPLRQWPPNNPTFREYEELKREGWYKADKA